jgi:histidinol-phosphate/aromatic aminotransferase/cobyric acid decarboxylase-like protein
MSLHRPAGRTSARRCDAFDSTIRLDLAQNPYGPCPAAIEAIEMGPESPSESLVAAFRRRLSGVYRVPAGSIHLLGSVDAAIRDIAHRHLGPVITFPPAATANLIAACRPGSETVSIARGLAGDAVIGPDFASDIPMNGLAVIDSPSNPLGSIVSPADTMRLSRACTCVLIDERFAEFSEFSLLPLALELDNVVVIRSFESWAGLPGVPCAWAVASPRLDQLFEFARPVVEPEAIAGAMATLHDRASVAATLKLVREERSRLYRFLRRLSFLEPLPSWAPFISARVTIVPRQNLIAGLTKRGIRVHAPPEPGLEEYVRIGIGSRTAMDRLRAALLELGPELVG